MTIFLSDPRVGAVPIREAAAVDLTLTDRAGRPSVELRGHAATYVVGGPLIALATAVVIADLVERTRLTSAAARMVASVGVLSYGAYLWNYPLTLWLRSDLRAVTGAVAVTRAIGPAWLSHRCVEVPARRAILWGGEDRQ